MKHIVVPSAIAALLLSASAFAKLPEPTPEAKAKAAETAAKTAWTTKIADYQLCQTMDKVAAAYRAQAKAEKKDVGAPVTTPACADPGAFKYTPPPEAKPIEAAGAHSPPQTASTPPSTTAPAAAQPDKK
jgi:hypothetical protein